MAVVGEDTIKWSSRFLGDFVGPGRMRHGCFEIAMNGEGVGKVPVTPDAARPGVPETLVAVFLPNIEGGL